MKIIAQILVIMAVGVIVISSCRKESIMTNSEGLATPVIEGDFLTPLAIPPSINGQGTLTAQVTTSTIFSGKKSKVLGYQSGSILGPSIVVNSGENININFQNSLAENSNIHWHGLITPAGMDGHPEDVALPGDSFVYKFTVSQRAGMYWYHPHPDGFTAKQAYLGLAGVFLVRDAEEQTLSLPSGEMEIPLVIQDKRINSNSDLEYSPNMIDIMTGYMGSNILVNGINSPYKDVRTRNYRLRVLNGSNGRIYNLALSDGASFTVIGADGGLLVSPQKVTSLLLGPGERADLIVNFSNYKIGTELFLASNTFSAGASQGIRNFRIMKFRVTQSDKDSFSLPEKLSDIETISKSSAIKTRTFDISNGGMGNMGGMSGMGSTGMTMKGMHRINNKVYDKSRIDETVRAGSTEIWEFDNSMGDESHPMHVHGLQFQVLDRNGGRNSLISTESGWKDTVLLLPGEKVHVIITFGRNKGKYVLHCHNLEHEDDGMMLQFEII
ncbi:MAG: multicopper oxidase domain-containing protein [Mariniphaga sp.]|nr:multicopper oxidase domain-containing protein [Mariniphaga sp.]